MNKIVAIFTLILFQNYLVAQVCYLHINTFAEKFTPHSEIVPLKYVPGHRMHDSEIYPINSESDKYTLHPIRSEYRDYNLNPNSASKLQFLGEIGYSFGVGKYEIDYLKFLGVILYKIKPEISLGLGSGLKYALDIDDVLIPFFADLRLQPITSFLPLYFALDIGYSLDVTSNYKSDGFYFFANPSAGFLFKISENANIHLGIGYEFQKFKLNYPLFGVIPGSTINTTGIGMNAGLSF